MAIEIMRKIVLFLIAGIGIYIAFSGVNLVWNETKNGNETTKQEDATRSDEKRKQQLMLYLTLLTLAVVLAKWMIL